MRRIVIIIPDLLGEPSFLRRPLPGFQRMAELGQLFQLSPAPEVETPEALFLGMGPGDGQLRQGPLTVSALGVDPPARSTHFHLSLLSFRDGIAELPSIEITPTEQHEILSIAAKLNTKSLTIIEGEGLDHGLVWEDLGELRTVPSRVLAGKVIQGNLPEGDAELPLRRFIDDSINLLSETELNRRRVEEDLPLLNLLWPWGEGVRTPVPNLALRRGEPALVLSNSMRLHGLSRLAGYRHGKRREFGRGTKTRLAEISEICRRETVAIVVLDAVSQFRLFGQLEEAEWFVREVDRFLLDPLIEQEATRITLLTPGQGGGLGMRFLSGDRNATALPFDERSLDERRLSRVTLWEAVASGAA